MNFVPKTPLGTFIRTDHILCQKETLTRFQNVEISQATHSLPVTIKIKVAEKEPIDLKIKKPKKPQKKQPGKTEYLLPLQVDFKEEMKTSTDSSQTSEWQGWHHMTYLDGWNQSA